MGESEHKSKKSLEISERNDWILLWIIDAPIIIIIAILCHILVSLGGYLALVPIEIFTFQALTQYFHRFICPEAFPPPYIRKYMIVDVAMALTSFGIRFARKFSNIFFIYVVCNCFLIMMMYFIMFPLPFYKMYVSYNLNPIRALKKPRNLVISFGCGIPFAAVGFVTDIPPSILGTMFILGVTSICTHVGIMILRGQKNEDRELQASIQILFCLIGAGGVIVGSAFWWTVHKWLEYRYTVIIGFFMIQAFGVMIFALLFEIVDLLSDRTNKHLLQLVVLPVQFFQEFAISFIFVDADPISEPFLFLPLLILVIFIDLSIESGLLYELYSRKVKGLTSEKRVAIYLAKKHQFIWQKIYAEPVATIAILFMTFIEFQLGDTFGINIISNFTSKRPSLGVMVGYIILLLVELATGQIGSYLLKQRMDRIRDDLHVDA